MGKSAKCWQVNRVSGSSVLSQLHLCLSRMQTIRVNLSTTQPLSLPLVLSCPLHMRHCRGATFVLSSFILPPLHVLVAFHSFRPLSYILCLCSALSKGIAYSAISRLDSTVMQEVWSGTLSSMSCFCEQGPFKICLVVCFQAKAGTYLLLMSVPF